MRSRIALAGLCLLLGGCSTSDGNPGTGADEPDSDWKTVDATDGSGSVEVPSGWARQREYLRRPVVIAEHGGDPAGTVRVSTYLDEISAERAAVESAGILGRSGVLCERIDDSDVFGEPHLVFDCPREQPGAPTRRTLLIPLTHAGGSALVLIEADAETLDDTKDLVQPVIESWKWG